VNLYCDELNIELELTVDVALLKLRYFVEMVHGSAGQFALTMLKGTMRRGQKIERKA